MPLTTHGTAAGLRAAGMTTLWVIGVLYFLMGLVSGFVVGYWLTMKARASVMADE